MSDETIWYRGDVVSTRKHRRSVRRRNAPGNVLHVSVRSKERKERRSRKAGGLLAAAFLVAVLIVGLVVGTRALARVMFFENDLFAVRNLVLDSDGKLTSAHIREYAGLTTGTNLFALSMRDVRERLESVPIVGTVEMERILPDTLRIRVSERVPLAAIDTGRRGLRLTIDREGYVLGPGAQSRHLPLIRGIQAAGLRPGRFINTPAVQDALYVLDICDTTRLGDFIDIEVIYVDRGDILDMELKDVDRVILPRIRMEAKMRQMAANLQTAREKGIGMASMDMRGDGSFVVRPR